MTSVREPQHCHWFGQTGDVPHHIGFADDMARDDDGTLHPVRSTLNGIRGYAEKPAAEFFFRQNAGHKHIRHGYRFDNWQVPVHLQLVLPDHFGCPSQAIEYCAGYSSLAIDEPSTAPARFRTLTSQQTPLAAESTEFAPSMQGAARRGVAQAEARSHLSVPVSNPAPATIREASL